MILNTIITDLAALTSIPSDNHVHVMGYNTPADGGGGDLYWDASSLEDANGGTIFESPLVATGPTNPGRWLRYYSESVNVKWFGATGDGTTDDSGAFQSMVDFCERTGVKDVVIPFGYFYLEESVYVKIGGIKFTGQGSLLREDSWWAAMSAGSNPLNPGSGYSVYSSYNYSDDIAYKGAIIVVNNDISGIVYDESVCDSVYWRGVGFRAKNLHVAGSTYAIDFKSKFAGPTWPFNVHECHFFGFNRVFNFDSGDNLYNIAFVNITNCGFTANDEVFYQGFNGESDNRFLCWGFNFQHNKCHNNSRVIYAYIAKDLVTISHNNFEGNIAYSDSTTMTPHWATYIIDMEIDNCAVQFYGNHFEQSATNVPEGVQADCVSISSLRKDADGNYKATDGTTALSTTHYVDIYGNNFNGEAPRFKPYTLTGCVVKIDEITPIYVHACTILENSNSSIFMNDYALQNGTIVKFANQSGLSSGFARGIYSSSIPVWPYSAPKAFLTNGEQWARTTKNGFGFGSEHYFVGDVKYCVASYKMRNNSIHFLSSVAFARFKNNGTILNPNYNYATGMLFPPFGEGIVVCIFPTDGLFSDTLTNSFTVGLSSTEYTTDTTETEYCSSIFMYTTKEGNPLVAPVFEASNFVDEGNGTFLAGQTWYDGANIRKATDSGTVGTVTGITVIGESENKIQLSAPYTYFTQGQYIEVGGNTYRIIELRDDWATLSSIPPSSVLTNSVTFHAPTFSTVKRILPIAITGRL